VPPDEPPLELDELLDEELPPLGGVSEDVPPEEPALEEDDELEDLPPDPPAFDELLELAPPEDEPPELELPPLEEVPEEPPVSEPEALVLAQAPRPVATPNTRPRRHKRERTRVEDRERLVSATMTKG
jgi:hypothetical protein